MKKMFVLSIVTSAAMICACQKKESTAQQQLTQSKTELGAREEELAERLNSVEEKVNWLDQTVKELAAKEKAAMNIQTTPTETPNAAQEEAGKEKMMQRLSAMAPTPSQLNAAEKEAAGMSPAPQ
jgi:uncharacterized protein YlxW (UPF0749 family)